MRRPSRPLAWKPLLFAIAVTAVSGFWLAHGGELGRALRAFARVRWGLVGVVLVRVATLLLCGAAWHVLVRRLAGLPLHVFERLRFIREGLNVLLPAGAIGGDLVGMRLITFWQLSTSVAVASIAVDVLVQAAAQAAFTLVGLALLASSFGVGPLALSMLVGVAALIAALVAFQFVQRRGMKPVERVLERFVTHGRIASEARLRASESSGLQAAMTTIWEGRSGLLGATALHLGAWFLGTLEVWIALVCMGHPRGWVVACILESLSQGLRSMAFPIPAGIGVQEGGLIAVGHIVGIDPGLALAISMVKRVPDLVVGIPALLAWVALEARHRVRRPREAAGAQSQ